MRALNEIDVTIGQRICQARAGKGVTQEELAGKLNISDEDLNLIETGRQKLRSSHLWMICDILSVPIEEFLEGLQDQPLATAYLH